MHIGLLGGVTSAELDSPIPSRDSELLIEPHLHLIFKQNTSERKTYSSMILPQETTKSLFAPK